jgi:hypothetical protein
VGAGAAAGAATSTVAIATFVVDFSFSVCMLTVRTSGAIQSSRLVEGHSYSARFIWCSEQSSGVQWRNNATLLSASMVQAGTLCGPGQTMGPPGYGTEGRGIAISCLLIDGSKTDRSFRTKLRRKCQCQVGAWVRIPLAC